MRESVSVKQGSDAPTPIRKDMNRVLGYLPRDRGVRVYLDLRAELPNIIHENMRSLGKSNPVSVDHHLHVVVFVDLAHLKLLKARDAVGD